MMLNMRQDQLENLLDGYQLQVKVWGVGEPKWHDITRAGRTIARDRGHEFLIPCRVGINGGTAVITARSKFELRQKPKRN
jgi:hypothetical protein